MIDPHIAARISENWQAVVADVQQAAHAARRSPSELQIIGVSKYVDAPTTAALAAAGCHQLGESRPQQLWQKAEALSHLTEVGWHLIGHLQTNKIRRTLRYRPVIHSVDSPRLLQALDAEAERQQIEVRVLLEVNISGEAAKTGLAADALEALLAEQAHGPQAAGQTTSDHATAAGGATVVGLMAMAGWGTSATAARRQFAQTRQLRDRLQDKTGVKLPELSMGMSGDFAEAIAEGATMVRIGSRLFEGIELAEWI